MRLILLILLLSLAEFTAAGAPHPAPAPAHSRDHADSTAPAEAQAKRWPADAPLRDAMQQIRHARALYVGSAADTVALAEAIDEAIGYMIRHCSLPAEADAALHGVIGQLGGAANALRGEDHLREAIAAVDGAIGRYAQLFDESHLD